MTSFTLPKLGYSYDSLEPFIDEKTMEIHHTKHHQAYVDNLNKAISGNSKLEEMDLEELIKNLQIVPQDIRTAVRNHGGGHHNHSFFWKGLAIGTEPGGELLKSLQKGFGGIDGFKKDFKKKSLTLFGSGWVWLVLNKSKLELVQTRNQDNPISIGMKPILGIDVWEHAYYLKYQNRRADYVDAFFSVIDWNAASNIFHKHIGGD